jgi:P4 family phage/plasmid primase-like protien
MTVEFGSSLSAAREYRRRGWLPIPYRPGEPLSRADWVDPILLTADLEPVFSPGTGVAIVLGSASGGLVRVGVECPEAVALAPAFLPRTAVADGPRKAPHPTGYWYVVNPPVSTARFSAPDGRQVLVEVWGEGSAVPAPPSQPAEGEVLEWKRFARPAEVSPADLMAAVNRLAAAALIARHWPAEEHQARTRFPLAVAAVLSQAGWEPADIRQFLAAVAQAAGDPRRGLELEDDGIRGLGAEAEFIAWPVLAEVLGLEGTDRLREWLGIQRPAAVTLAALELSDAGNGRRFAERFGHRLRFVDELGWLGWDGRRWAPVEASSLTEMGTRVVRSLYQEAAETEDGARRRALADHARRSESRSRLLAMVAHAERLLRTGLTELDADPMLFNVRNGILDLRTGQLLPHDLGRLITRLAGVTYDPRAMAPRWADFLNRVTEGDRELQAFLQRLVGYLLTGEASERVFFIVLGPPASGKTTFIRTVRRLLGDYAWQADPGTLLRNLNRPGVLAGVRLIALDPPAADFRVAERLVKSLWAEIARPGTGRVAGRTAFKVLIAADGPPALEAADPEVWQAARVIPFGRGLRPEEQDPHLPEKLAFELAGILNWAATGAGLWLRHGLGSARRVEEATAAYCERMDILSAFLEACCLRDPEARIAAGTLYQAYRSWCARTGNRPLPQNLFGLHLRRRGFIPRRAHGGVRLWQGLRLRDGLAAQPKGL